LIGVLLPTTARGQGTSTHVHLAFEAGEPDACHGSTYALTEPGDELHLVACVHTAEHSSTDTGADEMFLEWDVPSTVSVDPDPPPLETQTDGIARIRAYVVDGGEHHVTVRLCSAVPCEGAALISSATATIKVYETEHMTRRCEFNGTDCKRATIYRIQDGQLLIAVGSPRYECMANRPLLLKRKSPGSDSIELVRKTNPWGEATVRIRTRWRGQFYVVARRWSVDASDGRLTCRRKRSDPLWIS
jgi:hypothetical protein